MTDFADAVTGTDTDSIDTDTDSIDTDTDDTIDTVDGAATAEGATWRKSTCILCECNCGVEIRLGGATGRAFARVRIGGVRRGQNCRSG